MKNEYISKYAKNETHFRRTDPWPDIPFEEEDGLLVKIAASLGVALVVLVIVIWCLAS